MRHPRKISAKPCGVTIFSPKNVNYICDSISDTPQIYKGCEKVEKMFHFLRKRRNDCYVFSGFEIMEESEIVKAAKNYAIGEPTNKEDRRNLKNVKRQKCKLIAVVEVLGFLGSPILNMIYPGELSRDVEICLDILVDKYLPMFQDKQKGE